MGNIGFKVGKRARNVEEGVKVDYIDHSDPLVFISSTSEKIKG